MSVILSVNQSAFTGLDISTLDAVYNTAISVTGNAKSLAPFKYGQLRNSIQYVVGDGRNGGLNDNGGEERARATRLRPIGLNAIIAETAQHGAPQEFGTRYMAAKPHMRPAVQITRGRDARQIAEALKRRYIKETAIIKAKKKVLS